MLDNFSTHKVVLAEVPAAITGTATSDTIDLLGFNSVTCYVAFGADTTPPDGSNYWTCTIHESDAASSGFAAAAAGDVIGNTANAFGVVNSGDDDNAIYALGYKGTKRYLRIVVTETGAVSTTICAFAVLGNASDGPVSNTVQGS